jgi:cation transport ATPase
VVKVILCETNTMIHTYTITGMTCGSCEAKVKSSLLSMPHVLSAEVSKTNNSAIIEMDKHIPLTVFQKVLGGDESKYKISATHHNETAEQTRNWFTTYKPILLIFAYITTVSIIAGTQHGTFHWMAAMNIFMAGFFLTFSFFKMLDLKGFAESYAMYDIVAKQLPAWGYIYAFIELALGIAYAVNFQPLLTNAVTFLVMTVSIIGVLQSVLNKRAIKCACLGAVFNLPMSTVTIIEDLLMIVMSAIMLLQMI